MKKKTKTWGPPKKNKKYEVLDFEANKINPKEQRLSFWCQRGEKSQTVFFFCSGRRSGSNSKKNPIE